jgi:hypothetical protein
VAKIIYKNVMCKVGFLLDFFDLHQKQAFREKQLADLTWRVCAVE